MRSPAFYEKWAGDSLVIDKWFALQAMSPLANAADEVLRLSHHPAFDMLNPNRFARCSAPSAS